MEGNLDSGAPQIFACGVWDLGNVFSESWALESGIQYKESGIPLTRGIRNPGKFRWQEESRIHVVESTIQDWIPLHWAKIKAYFIVFVFR